MSDITAKIIKDSISEQGHRITTFELEYPRFIHGEIMTHRMFSRNAMSSRAVPVSKMLEQVRNNPAMPVHWGANQSGMQAEKECHNPILDAVTEDTYDSYCREDWWKACASQAANSAQAMSEAGYHKQIVNRLLEPFQMMKTVVTATEYSNFFELRCHKDAQPEIKFLADKMKDAMDNSDPILLEDGEWHIPYVEKGEGGHFITTPDFEGEPLLTPLSIEEALKVSASCCAQVSYRLLDSSVDKAIIIYDKLIESKPMHCYDEQTEVLTNRGFIKWPLVSEDDLLLDIDQDTLRIKGFTKPIGLIEKDYTGSVYSVESSDISMRITDGHKMIGHICNKATERYSEFKPTTYIANTITSWNSGKTMGEVEARIPLSPRKMSNIEPLGKVIGMYIGDGYKIDNTIGFHFKKEKKIQYLVEALEECCLEFSINRSNDGTAHIRVYKCDDTDDILNKCGSSCSTKEIGEWPLTFYNSIFDGLKNSDGSVKRNTWVYSTISEKLLKDFLDYAPLAGIVAIENKKQGRSFKIMVKTKVESRINDPRKPNSSVKIELVGYEKFYCATMPSGAMVVRRNGKTFISGNCSPFEHQAHAMAMGYHDLTRGVTHQDSYGYYWSGNFKGWVQYRQML